MMPEEEELTLYDYIKVISKRKWWIITGTLVCILAAGIVSLRLPTVKVYKTSLNLKVGKVWGSKIEDPSLISETMASEAFLARVIQRLDLKVTPAALKGRVQVKQSATRLLSLTATAGTPGQPTKIINTMANLIVEEHRKEYEAAMAPHYQYEKDLVDRTARVENDVKRTGSLLSHLEKVAEQDPAAIVSLQGQMGQAQMQLANFSRELRDVHLNNHSTLKSESTEVENPATEWMELVVPQRKRIVLIAAVLGALAALFMAFFLEYLEKMKEKEKASS